jgi:hypothetical protein
MPTSGKRVRKKMASSLWSAQPGVAVRRLGFVAGADGRGFLWVHEIGGGRRGC